MSKHPSPLITFLDEFQQILTEITKSSLSESGEFRKLYKDLNRLIATVRAELIQLDKIQSTMRSNSPAPIRLTKMYEEITTIIVQVIYFSFSTFLKKPLHSSLFHNKHESLTLYTQSPLPFYYKNPQSSFITQYKILNYRTQRKNLPRKPAEPTSSSPRRTNHHTHYKAEKHTPPLTSYLDILQQTIISTANHPDTLYSSILSMIPRINLQPYKQT